MSYLPSPELGKQKRKKPRTKEPALLRLSCFGTSTCEPAVGAGTFIELPPQHLCVFPSVGLCEVWGIPGILGSPGGEQGCALISVVQVQMTHVRSRTMLPREFDCKTEVFIYRISIYECF